MRRRNPLTARQDYFDLDDGFQADADYCMAWSDKRKLWDVVRKRDIYAALTGPGLKVFRGESQNKSAWPSKEYATDPGFYGRGVYYTTCPDVAQWYGHGWSAVHQGEIKLSNPLVLSEATADRLSEHYGILRPGRDPTPDALQRAQELTNDLLKRGYDGMAIVHGTSVEVVDYRPKRPKANPLDPYAYDTEPRPFTIPGVRRVSREEQIGVHTTTFMLAILYAVQRAAIHGNLSGGAPNCGIVFKLDTAGLKPLPDVDAMQRATYDDLSELLDDAGVQEALAEQDAEMLADALNEVFEFYDGDPSKRVTTWREAIMDLEGTEQPAALSLQMLDPMEQLDALSAAQQGLVPMQVYSAAVQQQRYMDIIGLDRLLAVYAIRPVEEELITYGDEDYDDPDREDRPQRFTDEWLDSAEDFKPSTVVLWERAEAPGARVEYHGTDISRAQSAFPELARLLVSPWPYTQPEL